MQGGSRRTLLEPEIANFQTSKAEIIADELLTLVDLMIRTEVEGEAATAPQFFLWLRPYLLSGRSSH